MPVVLGSPSKVPIQDVVGVGHLRCEVNGEIMPDAALETVVMDIYTGWILFGVGTTGEAGLFGTGTDDLSRDAFVSFLPLGTRTDDHFDVQGYPDGTTAIVSASPASFASSDTPSTCAIDSARVDLRSFSEFKASVLVLTANFALQNCMLNRVAYQVTVFAPPARMNEFIKVALPPDAIVPA
jgi:hypothetical protein